MGETDRTAPVNFTTPLAIFCCVFCPWFFTLYFVNRRIYPLAQREPMITLCGNIAFWLATQIWMFELTYYAIPCIVDNFAVQILVGITMVCFCMKVWKIFLDAGLTNELETEKFGWFVAHRSWRSRRSLNRVAGVLIFFHCCMFVVATVSDSEHALERGNTCDATTSSLILAGLGVIYLVIFVIASCKLAKVRDNFFIKSELRMVGMGSGFIALGWMTKVAADLPCVLYECGTMLLWFCWLACFLASTIYPLTKAMFDRRFVWWWDLCRRNVFLRQKEHLCSSSQADGDVSFADSYASRAESRNDPGSTIDADGSAEMRKAHHTERNPMRALATQLNPKDPALAKLKKVPLTRVLSFNNGKEAFRKFTVMEFSVENLLFMEAVNKFRALDAPTRNDVKDLYDKYVSDSAPSQVNLPNKTVRTMKNALATVEGPELRVFFDEALDHVMKLMQRDSYRRFQDTAEFASLAVEIEALRLSISAPPPAAKEAPVTETMESGGIEMASTPPLTPQTPFIINVGANSLESPVAASISSSSSSSSACGSSQLAVSSYGKPEGSSVADPIEVRPKAESLARPKAESMSRPKAESVASRPKAESMARPKSESVARPKQLDSIMVETKESKVTADRPRTPTVSSPPSPAAVVESPSAKTSEMPRRKSTRHSRGPSLIANEFEQNAETSPRKVSTVHSRNRSITEERFEPVVIDMPTESTSSSSSVASAHGLSTTTTTTSTYMDLEQRESLPETMSSENTFITMSSTIETPPSNPEGYQLLE